jgi:hypothetical protein
MLAATARRRREGGGRRMRLCKVFMPIPSQGVKSMKPSCQVHDAVQGISSHLSSIKP